MPRGDDDDLGAKDMMAGKFVEFDIIYRSDVNAASHGTPFVDAPSIA